MLAVISQKVTWYIARSSGMVAWALCTLSIVWGLLLSTRLLRKKGAPARLLDLHKFLGTLTLVFTLVHLVGLYLDTFVHFSLLDILVPLHASWRSWPVAWGIAAFYLLLAVQISSWMMKKIPRKIWKLIHFSSFLLFGFATHHSFTAGSDSSKSLVQLSLFSGIAIILFLGIFRLLSQRQKKTVTS
jgi:predicted ferric reductase